MTVQSSANASQIAYWNAVAGETWATQQERLDRQIEPLGLEAMGALSPKAGERILDIGCGCGQTSLELAERGAKVQAVDISEPMLAVARRRAQEAGADIAFLAADAQTEAFPKAVFDAAFSRFGVMFFEDPPAAFANIAKALKPGGRLAFVCWRPIAENAWMSAPFAAALPHIPPDAMPAPPAPNAPGPFAFADPDRVRAILTEAGFTDIDIRAHDRKIGGNDLETTVALSLKVGPLGALLREHPDLTETVVDAIREGLRPHVTDDGVLLPSGTWIVTARRP